MTPLPLWVILHVMKQINTIHLSSSYGMEQPTGDILKKMQRKIHSEGRLLTATDPRQRQEMLRFSGILFGTIVILVTFSQFF